MLQPTLLPGTRPRHVLCLGAHCDDIEIGCGGTLLTLLESNPGTEVTWVVLTSTEERRREATEGARRFAHHGANLDLRVFDLRDGFLPHAGAEVKELFEQLKRDVDPDLILTHYRHDLHQDHRLVNELTWNTFRDHLVLEYEIPKWDGDLGVPNTYIAISEDAARRKIELLEEVYASQRDKNWFTEDLFRSLMRIRGMECNSPSRLAEAFYARKVLFSPSP